MTPTGTNCIYVNDTKQRDASFSLLPLKTFADEVVPAKNNNKNNFKTKALSIYRDFAMLLFVNFVFIQFTYAVVTGPGIALGNFAEE